MRVHRGDASQQAMELDDPSHAIPMPNVEKLKALEGYFAWRRGQEGSKPTGGK